MEAERRVTMPPPIPSCGMLSRMGGLRGAVLTGPWASQGPRALDAELLSHDRRGVVTELLRMPAGDPVIVEHARER